MNGIIEHSAVPNDWAWTSLGDVCSAPQYGYTTKASQKGSLHLLRTTDITSGRIEWDTVPYCQEAPDDPDKYLLKEGDIVISRAGSIGVSHLVRNPERAVFASYLIRFRPFIDRNLFAYFLSSPLYWNAISEKQMGIAVPNVNANKLKGIEFPLPPLVEQRAIVEKIEALFSELDKGVEQLQAVRQQLKRYRQSVLKAAFEGKLTADWRAEQQAAGTLPSAEDLLAQIKTECTARYQQQLTNWQQAIKEWESVSGKTTSRKKPRKPARLKDLPPFTPDELTNLPDLPEGWVWIQLDALGELARGKSRYRPRNAEHLYGGPYPFIQTGEVKAANRVVRDCTQTYSEAGLAQSRIWPAGTLCITIAANIAETAFLGFDCCFPDSIVGFTASEPLVVPEYVEFFLQSAKRRISAFAPATAQKNINLTTLENLVVPCCCRNEQRILSDEIESRFSVLDELEKTVGVGLEQAEALRQSILKKAFEGRLLSEAELTAVRADPAYEPAEKLLERIRAERTKIETKKPQRTRRPKEKL